MDKFTAWLEKIVMPIADKIGKQRHLSAVKNGFIATMPLSLVGALAAMFSNVFFGRETLIGELLNRMGWYSEIVQPFLDATLLPVVGQIWWGTIALSVIFSTFTIAYSLANEMKEDGLAAGIVAVASYLILLPQSGDIGDGNYLWGMISWTSFNSSAIFAGLLTALGITEIFCFVKRKGWIIKMPEQVPPAVSKSFSAVIPAGIAMLIASIISTIFLEMINIPFGVWINEMLQAPLLMLGQSPISLVIIIFIQQFLWFFGLHGMLITEPILTAMYAAASAENAELVLVHGLEPIHAITRNFIDVYGMHGGSGATLGLIIAIFIFSKKQHYRMLAKMATPSGIFQINEPIIFGLPIVLNPIMAIPFLLVPPITIFVGWLFTAVIPFAGFLYLAPPWTTPAIINAFLASGGDIGATILAAATLGLSVLLYTPFVIMANNEKQ